jgi:hypothetical protein
MHRDVGRDKSSRRPNFPVPNQQIKLLHDALFSRLRF